MQEIKKEILKSKNYSEISDFTIERLITEGSIKYKKQKDIVKYVKKELHIIWGAFFKKFVDFDKYIDNPEKLIQIHNSTNERISFISDFYIQIFKNIPIQVNSIADYGCGLNPLNIQHMNLKSNTTYYAYDIYKPEIEFLNKYGERYLKNIHLKAEVRDLFEEDSNQYDVVFLFKILPVLEEQKKGSSIEILKRINTKYFVISFPLRSLSGKNVGMDSFYTDWFENILSELQYEYSKLLFENEVVYIVKMRV